MKLRPEEITSILKQRIEEYDVETDLAEVGTVLQVGDGIARVYGLENASRWRCSSSSTASPASRFNLEEDNVGVALFGDWQQIKEGAAGPPHRPRRERAGRRGADRPHRRPARQPARRRARSRPSDTRPLEFKAPGVVERQPVKEPLQTGIKAIDSMIPIGRGQRELIIGDRVDRQDGDRVDTIINQSGRRRDLHLRRDRPEGLDGRPGVRAAEGRGRDGVHDHRHRARRTRPRRSSGWRRTPAARWASTSCYNGKHALCIYDDLSKHADAYRQMSLLLRRPPGREAFPGDVFYLHSRLLERACKLSDELGGGSLTALPIIETQAGDVVGLHPDERDLDHRRADLPRVRPLLLGRPPGDQRRHLGLARRRQRPDEGDEEGRRPAPPRPRPVPRAGGVRAVRLRARRRRRSSRSRAASGWSRRSTSRSTSRGRSRSRSSRSTPASTATSTRSRSPQVPRFQEELREHAARRELDPTPRSATRRTSPTS